MARSYYEGGRYRTQKEYDPEEGVRFRGRGCPPGYIYDASEGGCIPMSAAGGPQPTAPRGLPPSQYRPLGGPMATGVPRVGASGYERYLQKTPEEQEALATTSQLARMLAGSGAELYGVGLPAYRAATDYMTAILGGSKAAASRAIGPQAEQIADIYRGAKQAAELGPLRGGAQETALAELSRVSAGRIASLIPELQREMVGQAASTGLAGATAGQAAAGQAAGIFGGLAAGEREGRLAGGRFALEEAGLGVQQRAQDIQAILGERGLELQGRGLDLQERLGLAGLEQSREAQEWLKQYQGQLLDISRAQMAQQERQIAAQRKQASGAKWGGLLGTAMTVGGTVLGGALGGPPGAAAGGAAGGAAGKRKMIFLAAAMGAALA